MAIVSISNAPVIPDEKVEATEGTSQSEASSGSQTPATKGEPLFRPTRSPPKSDLFEDLDFLRFTLQGAVSPADLESTVHHLLHIYGDYGRVVAASDLDLGTQGHLDDAAVMAVRLVRALTIRLARLEILNREVLGSIDKVVEYLSIIHGRSPVECTHLLFLDAANRLINDEILAHGTVNHTPAYPREILRRAIECNAVSIILAHNHPSGDPEPSAADIRETRNLARAAKALGVTLYDHLIVATGGVMSFRQRGLL